MLGSGAGAVNGILGVRRLDSDLAWFAECLDARQDVGAVMIQEHARFQLEANRLGRDHVFQVTVFEKDERRRKRYFAETQCSDPFHLVIQFIIRDAPNLAGLVRRFVGQLEHRGFEPRRMRVCEPTGKWQPWGPVPHVGEAPMHVPDESSAIDDSPIR